MSMTKNQTSFFSNEACADGQEPQEAILFIFFGLGLGVLAKKTIDAFHVPVPYTVSLLLLGLAWGGLTTTKTMGLLGDAACIISTFDPHLLLVVFLPMLIFESAFSLEWHAFKAAFFPALTLAVPGMLLNTFVTGVVIYYIILPELSWNSSFLLGAILSARDPIAVVALLKELGGPQALATLIEAESLLCDGTAIVVFEIFRELASGVNMSSSYGAELATQLALGGPALGLAWGIVTIFIIGRIIDDDLAEVSMTLLSAYLLFYVAEDVCHVSGVLALVVMGVCFAAYGKTRISPRSEASTHSFWRILTYVGNTLIFLVVGIVLVIGHDFSVIQGRDWGFVVVLWLFLTIIRGIVMIVFAYPLRLLGYHLTWKEHAILIHGSLRGAVSLALALLAALDHHGNDPSTSLPNNLREKVLFYTGGVAFLTLIINASTTGLLLQSLGLVKEAAIQKLVFDNARETLRRLTVKCAKSMSKDKLFAMANWDEAVAFVAPPRFLSGLRFHKPHLKESSSFRRLQNKSSFRKKAQKQSLLFELPEINRRRGTINFPCELPSLNQPSQRHMEKMINGETPMGEAVRDNSNNETTSYSHDNEHFVAAHSSLHPEEEYEGDETGRADYHHHHTNNRLARFFNLASHHFSRFRSHYVLPWVHHDDSKETFENDTETRLGTFTQDIEPSQRDNFSQSSGITRSRMQQKQSSHRKFSQLEFRSKSSPDISREYCVYSDRGQDDNADDDNDNGNDNDLDKYYSKSILAEPISDHPDSLSSNKKHSSPQYSVTFRVENQNGAGCTPNILSDFYSSQSTPSLNSIGNASGSTECDDNHLEDLARFQKRRGHRHHRRPSSIQTANLQNARLRFLVCSRAIYWELFESGFLERQGVVQLVNASEKEEEKIELDCLRPIQDWTKDLQRFVRTPWPLKLLQLYNWRKLEPLRQTLMRKYEIYHASLCVNVADAFIAAHRKVLGDLSGLLSEVARDSKNMQQLVQESFKNIEEAKQVVRAFPHEVVSVVRTRQAASLLLTVQEEALTSKFRHGVFTALEHKYLSNHIRRMRSKLILHTTAFSFPDEHSVLRWCHLMEDLSNDDLKLCSQYITIQTFNEKEELIRVEDACSGIYIILQGYAYFHVPKAKNSHSSTEGLQKSEGQSTSKRAPHIDFLAAGRTVGVIETVAHHEGIVSVRVASHKLRAAFITNENMQRLFQEIPLFKRNAYRLCAFQLCYLKRQRLFSIAGRILPHARNIARAPFSVQEDLWPFVLAGSIEEMKVKDRIVLGIAGIAVSGTYLRIKCSEEHSPLSRKTSSAIYLGPGKFNSNANLNLRKDAPIISTGVSLGSGRAGEGPCVHQNHPMTYFTGPHEIASLGTGLPPVSLSKDRGAASTFASSHLAIPHITDGCRDYASVTDAYSNMLAAEHFQQQQFQKARRESQLKFHSRAFVPFCVLPPGEYLCTKLGLIFALGPTAVHPTPTFANMMLYQRVQKSDVFNTKLPGIVEDSSDTLEEDSEETDDSISLSSTKDDINTDHETLQKDTGSKSHLQNQNFSILSPRQRSTHKETDAILKPTFYFPDTIKITESTDNDSPKHSGESPLPMSNKPDDTTIFIV